MLEFVCDSCGRVKEPEQSWTNGVAIENVGTRAARREVVIDAAWRYERAVLPLAVHFCSVSCKDHYLAKLFQQPMPFLEIESVRVPAAGERVVRARKKPASHTAVKRTARVRKR